MKDARGHGSNPGNAREERIALNMRADQRAMMPRGQYLGRMGDERITAINQAAHQMGVSLIPKVLR